MALRADLGRLGAFEAGGRQCHPDRGGERPGRRAKVEPQRARPAPFEHRSAPCARASLVGSIAGLVGVIPTIGTCRSPRTSSATWSPGTERATPSAVRGHSRSAQSEPRSLSVEPPLATSTAPSRRSDLTPTPTRVEVLSDPFGMQAIYTAERYDRAYFSTCATTLARHLSAPPDSLGYGLFLRTGYQFDPLTDWPGVERLGPAISLGFDGGRPRSQVC